MNKKLLKQILLIILFVIFLNLGFFYLKTLLFKEVEILSTLIPFLIFLLFGATFFIFFLFSRPSLKLQIPVYLLVFAFILLRFGVSGYIIVGGLIFALFLFLSQITLSKERENLLKISFCHLSQKGCGILLTGAAILISILLFLSPRILGGEINLPRPLFDLAWPMTEKFFASQFPGFFGDMTVDQFLMLQMYPNIDELLEKYLKSQTPKQTPGPTLPFQGQIEIEFYKEIQKQLDEAKKGISQEVLQKGREELAKTFQIDKKLKGDEKMKNVFYEMVSNLIAKNVKSWEKFGMIGLILIFFMLIKTVSIIFNYVALLISWIIFKILIAIKFFMIRTVKVDKEEIVLE